MRVAVLWMSMSCTLAVACARTTPVVDTGSAPAQEMTAATSADLAKGIELEVALERAIDTSDGEVGAPFAARVTRPLRDARGAVLVPVDARVDGVISALEPAQGAAVPALMRLEFRRLTIDGRRYPLDAAVESVEVPKPIHATRRKLAASGAVVGAILGASFRKVNVKDVVVGGTIGAAAGTLISLGTDSGRSRLPAGTHLTLRLRNRVALDH